jgi:hypothetical protein
VTVFSAFATCWSMPRRLLRAVVLVLVVDDLVAPLVGRAGRVPLQGALR